MVHDAFPPFPQKINKLTFKLNASVLIIDIVVLRMMSEVCT